MLDREIKLLDDNLINKIAAGEVIERPASIVKELVENSIDAGAKNIIIEIRNGGISYIKIQDDGKGIEKPQIKTAFLRHATSKLEKLDDLDSILTLGFRGEALASIASIARVEMITKTKNDQIGTRISIENAQVISEQDVAALNGTTFIIKDIFFNTPARRKFLKKDSVEGSYISEMVNRLALGHPHISFEFINNGVEIIKTNGDNNIETTAFFIYGKEIIKKMIPIKASKNGFTIEGLISLPELARGNRSYENFFINGRYIKSNLVNSAIEGGYNGKLMVSKFPIFIINMIVPENTVDVNVHPTKLEVRFEDENFISLFLSSAVEKALKAEVLIPNIEIDNGIKKFSEVLETMPYSPEKQKALEDLLVEDEEELAVTNLTPVLEQDYIFDDIAVRNNVFMVNETATEEKTLVNSIYDKKDLSYNITKIGIKDNPITPRREEKLESEFKKDTSTQEKVKKEDKKHSFFNNYKIVGQVFNTYWIIEQEKELFIIDQHSAHEKVIYEELYEKYKTDIVPSQKLIEPIVIKVSAKERAVIEENFELFTSFGFDIEDFGLDCYAIREVPFIFKGAISPSFFVEILDALMDKNVPINTSIYDAKIEKIISMSCKKAVKANDRLSFIEAKSLIEKILKLEDPFNCPHGRPTIIKMTKYEIEKLFKRIQN